jgi:hypothetical protein
MAEPLGFNAEAIALEYYDNPTDLEALVKALVPMIRVQTGQTVTAEQVGAVLDEFAADAIRVKPKGGFRGWLEEA